jgi:hypothetical protein
MSTETQVTRPRATVGVTKSNSAGVLARAKAMYTAILAAIAMFPSPTISMAAFLTLIQAFETAQQTTTTTRARGTSKARNTKRNAVWTAMESLRTYVQGLADELTPDPAAALIEAAGLLVAGKRVHAKPVLQAKLTTTPGVVHLVANASILLGKTSRKKATFHWQWSADGGKTWTSAPSTPYANTEIPGLALMTTYTFRVSVTIGKVTGEWSQPVGLLVH